MQRINQRTKINLMKNLKKEIQSYIAEKLIFLAMCLNPESVFKAIPKKSEIMKERINTVPFIEVERIESKELVKMIVAQSHVRGWDLLQFNEKSYLIQIAKEIKGRKVKMSIYYKKDSRTCDMKLTVSTSMQHPTRGKTQLHRKNVGKRTFYALLVDPRTHTGSGYYKK